jgi:hypothetical protein
MALTYKRAPIALMYFCVLQVEKTKGKPDDKFGRPLQPAQQLDPLGPWGPQAYKALMVANCGTCKSSWNA